MSRASFLALGSLQSSHLTELSLQIYIELERASGSQGKENAACLFRELCATLVDWVDTRIGFHVSVIPPHKQSIRFNMALDKLTRQ
jgi:hypothetical protein